jgi:hypothetical protein
MGRMAMSTDTTKLDVSVIIPHYNDPVRLRLCLTALFNNDTRGVEIIVVDNGSPTPIDALIADFPTVTFLTEPEKGAAPARNAGVAASSGAILAFIDADCVPDLDWLSIVRSAAARADLVGGRVSVFDETPPPRIGAEAFEAVFAFNFKRYIEKQGFSGAGNLLTTRKVFDAVGPFRNGVSEDTEWTRRAVSMGYRLVYADDLRVGHPSRQDWPALREKWRRMTREGFALGGRRGEGAASLGGQGASDATEHLRSSSQSDLEPKALRYRGTPSRCSNPCAPQASPDDLDAAAICGRQHLKRKRGPKAPFQIVDPAGSGDSRLCRATAAGETQATEGREEQQATSGKRNCGNVCKNIDVGSAQRIVSGCHKPSKQGQRCNPEIEAADMETRNGKVVSRQLVISLAYDISKGIIARAIHIACGVVPNTVDCVAILPIICCRGICGSNRTQGSSIAARNGEGAVERRRIERLNTSITTIQG